VAITHATRSAGVGTRPSSSAPSSWRPLYPAEQLSDPVDHVRLGLHVPSLTRHPRVLQRVEGVLHDLRRRRRGLRLRQARDDAGLRLHRLLGTLAQLRRDLLVPRQDSRLTVRQLDPLSRGHSRVLLNLPGALT
jgi:hypothetical protein